MAASESTGKTGDVPALIAKVAALQNLKEYAELNWEGDVRGLPRHRPQEPRGHAQRVPARLRHDPVVRAGRVHRQQEAAHPLQLLQDEHHGGRDAIYGLDIPLMQLVNVLHSAAQRYGTERRVILLHGPVGCSKSTIARLLKSGIEEYSRTPEGALYTFEWVIPEKLAHITGGQTTFKCPMHEEPLHLIPPDWRDKALVELGLNGPGKPHDPHRRRSRSRPAGSSSGS